MSSSIPMPFVKTLLGLFLLGAQAAAQTQSTTPTSQNLTLRFFPQAQSSCSYTDSAKALTFTTSSLPKAQYCFNFPDVVMSNATSGYTEQHNNRTTNATMHQGDFHWQIQNAHAFDPSANYSNILYRQHGVDELLVGAYSLRRVKVYSVPDCKIETPSASSWAVGPASDPWYGFGCWSDAEGSCGTLPNKIASFSIGPGDDDESGACMVFARNGLAEAMSAAAEVQSSTAVVVLVAITVGIWGML